MNDEQVITVFSVLVAENPGDPRFARLGDTYIKKGNLRKALEVLTAGVGANPTYSTGQQVLARALLKAGYLKEARDRFEIVLRIDPGNAVALWEIARIDFKQGNTEDGIERLKGLLCIDPFDEKAKRELNNLNVEVDDIEAPPPPQEKKAEIASAQVPISPPTTRLELDTPKVSSGPSLNEIASVEKELEELLKMDISSSDEAKGLGLEEFPSLGEGFLERESSLEPAKGGEEEFTPKTAKAPETPHAAVVPTKTDNFLNVQKMVQNSLEEAVSSIEDSMPAFDLGEMETSVSEQPEPAPPQETQAPAFDVGSDDMPSLGMDEAPTSHTAAEETVKIEEQTAFEHGVIEEEMPSFDAEAPAKKFDFTPPSQEGAQETSAVAGLQDITEDKEEAEEIGAGFNFTSPPEETPVSHKESQEAEENSSEDFFDFTPPEKQKSAPIKHSSIEDALKQIEVVSEPEEIEEVEESEEAFSEDVSEPISQNDESENVTDDDLPVFDMGSSEPEQEQSITGIGGYQFTETISDSPTSDSDEEVFEFRHEFQPADEPIELEGFEGPTEFNPPSNKPGGPEFAELDFADELDGIAPREESVETPQENPVVVEEADDSDLSDEPEMQTVTMAEIYAGQGEIKKAILVYKAILNRTTEPSEIDRVEKRVEHLQKLLLSGSDAGSS
ncbi:hypothetical protein KAH81_02415 [bacterium]|nr:hypothetical protein [bacterium]